MPQTLKCTEVQERPVRTEDGKVLVPLDVLDRVHRGGEDVLCAFSHLFIDVADGELPEGRGHEEIPAMWA